jgi:hypothetical protein
MSRAFDFDPKDLELPPEIAAKAKRDTAAAAPRARISGIKRKDASPSSRYGGLGWQTRRAT